MTQRTPSSVTTLILELCADINPHARPRFVRVKPEPDSLPQNCFWNVRQKTERQGGRIQFGWAIWDSSFPYIEAEHHAVYAPPNNGTWLDLTPDPDGPRWKRLFLADDAAIYHFDKRNRGLANIRKTLVDDPLLDELFRLADEHTAFTNAIIPNVGEIKTLTPTEAEYDRRNKQRRMAIQWQLAMKYTPRQALCFCSSGRKFKSCHGKAA